MSDAVATFKAISWLIFKWVLIGFAALVLLGGTGALGLYGYRWYSHDRHGAKVQFLIKYDEKECEQLFPLHILVGNLSERQIDKVSFRIEARRPGYSTNLVRFETFSNDKIIPPQEGWASCWRLPQLSDKIEPSSLEWMVVSPSVSFSE